MEDDVCFWKQSPKGPSSPSFTSYLLSSIFPSSPPNCIKDDQSGPRLKQQRRPLLKPLFPPCQHSGTDAKTYEMKTHNYCPGVAKESTLLVLLSTYMPLPPTLEWYFHWFSFAMQSLCVSLPVTFFIKSDSLNVIMSGLTHRTEPEARGGWQVNCIYFLYQ